MLDQEHQPEASHRSKRGRCEKGTCSIPDTRAQHKDEHDEHDREGGHNACGSWTEHGAQSEHAGDKKGDSKRPTSEVAPCRPSG